MDISISKIQIYLLLFKQGIQPFLFIPNYQYFYRSLYLANFLLIIEIIKYYLELLVLHTSHCFVFFQNLFLISLHFKENLQFRETDLTLEYLVPLRN